MFSFYLSLSLSLWADSLSVMAGPDSEEHPDEDSRLDFRWISWPQTLNLIFNCCSIENEINQMSPLVSLVSGPVSCVPPYKASQELMLSCPGPGPATSILVRETPAGLSQEVRSDNKEEKEKQEEREDEEGQKEEEVKKDYLSPPSVASSLVCLQARRRSSLSLLEQKFKSM